eukprot:NODE_4604_length_1870_cov_5.458979.p1 GENE.NODE_4604_length_1870_cov_5.458979~~NODE_4604_length_1870_cov_5.458979.p1  ORF type:complete len:439 (+),score=93.16 NODE_4604_length_1870_cov_5.458979:316-1632(+)
MGEWHVPTAGTSRDGRKAAAAVEKNAGLGFNVGGSLARRALGNSGDGCGGGGIGDLVELSSAKVAQHSRRKSVNMKQNSLELDDALVREALRLPPASYYSSASMCGSGGAATLLSPPPPSTTGDRQQQQQRRAADDTMSPAGVMHFGSTGQSSHIGSRGDSRSGSRGGHRTQRQRANTSSKAASTQVLLADHALETPVRTRIVQGDMCEVPRPDSSGLVLALSLNCSPIGVTKEELQHVANHRWTFPGATEFASWGKAMYFFVRCFLEMQANIQLDESSEALLPRYVNACALFVKGHCLEGHLTDMFNFLSHFLTNTNIFPEWRAFILAALTVPDAGQDAVLSPYLDQALKRFMRLARPLEIIFAPVDDSRCRRASDRDTSWLPVTIDHQFPPIADFIRDVARRRFLPEEFLMSAVFQSSSNRSEVIGAIKREFNLWS